MIETWDQLRAAERAKPYWPALRDYVLTERERFHVYPEALHTQRALDLTPLAEVRAVIVGQDPYFLPGLACGLAFSVPPGIPLPVSLRVLLTELQGDLASAGDNAAAATIAARLLSHRGGVANGCLEAWARRGVLLLNDVLTVRAGEAGSHAGKGWEHFTDAVLRAVAEQPRPIAFLLMGSKARDKARRGALRTTQQRARHAVVTTPHPAARPPISMRGSRPFSRLNRALAERGAAPIDWSLP